MKQINTVLFDFDGVICSDYFYFTLEDQHSRLYSDINEHIFHNDNYKKLINQWMRGALTYQKFNRVIAKKLGTKSSLLDDALESSVRQMTMNEPLLEFSSQLRSIGIKTIIFTDNMDIFEKVTIPHHKLGDHFDDCFSSHKHNLLKKDQDWQLLDKVLTAHNTSYEETLLIDDSKSIGSIMEKRGGNFYLYPRGGHVKDFWIFKNWFDKNLATS